MIFRIRALTHVGWVEMTDPNDDMVRPHDFYDPLQACSIAEARSKKPETPSVGVWTNNRLYMLYYRGELVAMGADYVRFPLVGTGGMNATVYIRVNEGYQPIEATLDSSGIHVSRQGQFIASIRPDTEDQLILLNCAHDESVVLIGDWND